MSVAVTQERGWHGAPLSLRQLGTPSSFFRLIGSLPRRVRWLLGAACVGTLLATTALAGCKPPPGDYDLLVGIRPSKPFVYEDDVFGTTGLTVELWEAISADLENEGFPAQTAFVTCTLSEQLDGLAFGTLDLVISPLTITAERMALFDFSMQYLSSGLTIARPRTAAIDFSVAGEVLHDTIVQPGMARAIIIFLFINLCIGFIALRVLNDSVLGGRPDEHRVLRGIRYIIESVVRTIGLRSLGDKYATFTGRILEIFMAIVGTLLSATVFGVLTSAFTSAIGSTREVTPRQLVDMRVVTLVDSTAQRFLEEMYLDVFPEMRIDPDHPLCLMAESAPEDAKCIVVQSWREAMDRIVAGEAEVVLGDWVQLSYLARQGRYGNKIAVQPSTYLNEPYGWGISDANPELRQAIDRHLSARIRNPYWRPMIQSYLGAGSISPQ